MKTTEEYVKENNVTYIDISEKIVYFNISSRLKLIWQKNNDLTMLAERLTEAEEEGVCLSINDSNEFVTGLVDFVTEKISDDDILSLIQKLKEKLNCDNKC